MRAKFIYEKFLEDSDPIKDMEIGLDTHRTFKDQKELTKWVFKYLPHILKTDKIPKDIIYDNNYFLKKEYVELIERYALKYFDVLSPSTFSFRNLDVLPNWKILRNRLEKKGYKSLK